MTNPIALSDHHAQQNDLAPGTTLHGHKITVKGLYKAKKDKRDINGAAVSREVEYQESFEFPAGEHLLTPANALSSLLKGPLEERLRSKDKEFRGIKTHEIVSHDNITE